MMAISLWEPWATAMALEMKRNETRSWTTRYRGDLLICASKRPLDVTANETLDFILRHTGIRPIIPNPGHALCVVRVVRCDTITATYRKDHFMTFMEGRLGDYTPGRFAWVTTDTRRLQKPIPVTGRQGLFQVSDELIKAAM